MNFDFENGAVLLIDKPYGWTSFDVVKKIRNTIRIKKVGHAGTLDPLATGLLVLCTGKLTKTIDSIQKEEKEYTGEMILGFTTPSYDLETEIIPFAGAPLTPLTIDEIKLATLQFLGITQQVPPVFSAIRVDGVRLYKKARKGEEVEIKSREVHIKEFVIEEYNYPSLKFRVVCSKGTYIRSLVHDFGQLVGTGAYLSALRRTKIGALKIEEAFQLQEFVEKVKSQQSNF